MLAFPLPADSAPATAPWTLARTLDTLRQRRLVLIGTSRGLRVRHQHRHDLPGLADALAAYAEPLRVWHRLGGTDARIPAPWAAPDWDAATRLFAAWFGLLFVMPAGPLPLRQGETIRDAARFRAAVIARLALGPTAPDAGRLRADLAALFARYGRAETATSRRTLPLAA